MYRFPWGSILSVLMKWTFAVFVIEIRLHFAVSVSCRQFYVQVPRQLAVHDSGTVSQFAIADRCAHSSELEGCE